MIRKNLVFSLIAATCLFGENNANDASRQVTTRSRSSSSASQDQDKDLAATMLRPGRSALQPSMPATSSATAASAATSIGNNLAQTDSSGSSGNSSETEALAWSLSRVKNVELDQDPTAEYLSHIMLWVPTAESPYDFCNGTRVGSDDNGNNIFFPRDIRQKNEDRLTYLNLYTKWRDAQTAQTQQRSSSSALVQANSAAAAAPTISAAEALAAISDNSPVTSTAAALESSNFRKIAVDESSSSTPTTTPSTATYSNTASAAPQTSVSTTTSTSTTATNPHDPVASSHASYAAAAAMAPTTPAATRSTICASSTATETSTTSDNRPTVSITIPVTTSSPSASTSSPTGDTMSAEAARPVLSAAAAAALAAISGPSTVTPTADALESSNFTIMSVEEWLITNKTMISEQATRLLNTCSALIFDSNRRFVGFQKKGTEEEHVGTVYEVDIKTGGIRKTIEANSRRTIAKPVVRSLGCISPALFYYIESRDGKYHYMRPNSKIDFLDEAVLNELTNAVLQTKPDNLQISPTMPNTSELPVPSAANYQERERLLRQEVQRLVAENDAREANIAQAESQRLAAIASANQATSAAAANAASSASSPAESATDIKYLIDNDVTVIKSPDCERVLTSFFSINDVKLCYHQGQQVYWIGFDMDDNKVCVRADEAGEANFFLNYTAITSAIQQKNIAAANNTSQQTPPLLRSISDALRAIFFGIRQ